MARELAPAGTSAGRSGGAWADTFASFRHRDFVFFWTSQVATSGGYWMDQVARGWLAFDISDSPFALGATFALRAIPILVMGPIAGVVADRWNRRAQLIISQASNCLINLSLAVLIMTNTVELWHVLVTAFLTGSAQAFQQPTRQSILPGTVPRHYLSNAVGLSSAGLSLMRTVAPAVAGVVIAVAGAGGAYLVQAGLYVVAIVLTLQMGIKPLRPDRTILSPWASLVEGLRYISRQEMVAIILISVLIPVTLTGPYVSMLSVFARDILEIGAAGLGALVTCTGLGAVVGALWLAANGGHFPRKGLLVIGGAISLSVSVAVFALATWLPLALLMLVVAGVSHSIYYSAASTLLHFNIEDEIRGRVMSVLFFEQGLVPFGTFLVGTLAMFTGVQWAVAGFALLSALLMTWVLVRSRTLRNA